MPDVFEEQAVLIAAEQAAAEGDAIAAEGHLRKLLFLQAARLGPEHQDVASTVHNLAIVCERAGRFGEAEFLFRRANAVAAAVLPPTDQLAVRCQEDLNAFLAARVTAVQSGFVDPAPPAHRIPASAGRKPSPSSASRTPARPASRVRPPAQLVPEPRPVMTRGTIAGIAMAVLAALGTAWMVFGRSAARTPEPAPVALIAAPVKRPTPTPAKKPTAPGATPTAPPSTARPVGATAEPALPSPAASTPDPAAFALPAESARTESGSPAQPAPAESTPAATNVSAIAVTDARLCGDLTTSGRWTCTAPGQPVATGRLAFLTRLAVPSTLQVEHRWYHGTEMIRSVSLRVPPAGTLGYRTYSRQMIDAARTGEWRVELRAPDGTVLAEERFTVQ